MSAVPDRNSTTDLAVLGATTVGYYLVNDLVKGPRLRRAVAAGVLATGAHHYSPSPPLFGPAFAARCSRSLIPIKR
ncbi:hypothetical protein [Corynebacterium provencense]|uniref:hypothetical protein n=1 Tax=Corynebacterium provencense TaxID=1737425 RepID=UPI00082CB3A9|nr:hypothetical protein [Corynebacterium provencense]